MIMSETAVANKQTTKKHRPIGKDVSTQRRVARSRRHSRLRKKVAGTVQRPRMVVTRSSRHITVQVVDDQAGHTMASATSMEADVRGLSGDKKAKASKVGELAGDRAREAGISRVVFDRGGHTYHGRVAALADAARGAGLEF